MKTYRIESRATVIRHRIVKANSAEEAEAKSIEAKIDHEEDDNEETLAIIEVEK